jgi:prepilin-type N-terminal cleavage/methylation domain-containing protein
MIRFAFTLIELLIALSLGSIVLLVAITTLRSAGQAIAEMSRVSAENDALRAGWLNAMDDADFWRSHAEPSFPFGKAFTSEEPAVDAQYRPFRAWQPNARGLQAINPASWDGWSVTGFMPDVITPQPSRYLAKGGGGQVRFEDSNPLTWYMILPVVMGNVAISDLPLRLEGQGYRSGGTNPEPVSAGTTARGHFYLPAGWDPWHIVGSFAAIANVQNHRGQESTWRTYAQLGHLGVNAYAEPGTPSLVVTPPSNRAAIASVSRIQPGAAFPTGFSADQLELNWGEIPYALTGSHRLDGSRSSLDSLHYVRGLPGPVRGFFTPPAAPADLFQNGNLANSNPSNVQWLSLSQLRFSGQLRQFSMDLDLTTSRWLGIGDRAAVPHIMVYPNRLLRLTTGWDADQLFTDWTSDPQRPLWIDGADVNSPAARTRAPLRQTLSTRIALVPASAPDWDQTTHATVGRTPSVQHEIFRIRENARDATQLRITAQRDDGSRPVVLIFEPLSTTYRGARMHWGTQTVTQPIGDRR